MVQGLVDPGLHIPTASGSAGSLRQAATYTRPARVQDHIHGHLRITGLKDFNEGVIDIWASRTTTTPQTHGLETNSRPTLKPRLLAAVIRANSRTTHKPRLLAGVFTLTPEASRPAAARP